MKNSIYIPTFKTREGRLLLIALAAALTLGLALTSPAFGAGLGQTEGGDISGTVTVNSQGAAGITVELRQRSNGGADLSLGTTTTDATGTYHFTKQPSAPSDAFFYIHFTGGTGTLAMWNSFPIIYLSGSDISVPSVEMADVALEQPANAGSLALPAGLKWKARRSGETYRVFVYAEGKTDKPALDSGSLGTAEQFSLSPGTLSEGKYEALVQVRDAVVGYGQSREHFHFTVGKASHGEIAPIGEAPQVASPSVEPTKEPVSGNDQAPAATQIPAPDLKVNLSADKTTVDRGDSLVYKIEVMNTGTAAAGGVVVTDKLPEGVTLNTSGAKSTAGEVSVEGNIVKAQVGDLAPNGKAIVEIPVNVGQQAGSNVSNQASVAHTGATEPVQSNAYISQVAEPASGTSGSQPQRPDAAAPQQPAGSTTGAAPQQPDASVPQQPVGGVAGNAQGSAPSNPPASQPAEKPQAPAANPPSSSVQKPSAAQPQQPSTTKAQEPATRPAARQPAAPAQKQPAAPVPQTGGSFPVVFALLLVIFTLLARYLRGHRYRRV